MERGSKRKHTILQSKSDGKRPFAIAVALDRIRAAVQPYPPAAMFQLADEGYATLFQQVVACILSTRTRDEVSLVLARQLFGVAPNAADVARLGLADLEALIQGSTFYRAKAPQILSIANTSVNTLGGELPADVDVLKSLPGVGPKCAHLALGVAAGQAWISVDVHVHRVTNRWGYVHSSSPEGTLERLEGQLPREHWVEINRLLVPFGKHICTGKLPACSHCPVLDMCQQVGVTAHR